MGGFGHVSQRVKILIGKVALRYLLPFVLIVVTDP